VPRDFRQEAIKQAHRVMALVDRDSQLWDALVDAYERALRAEAKVAEVREMLKEQTNG